MKLKSILLCMLSLVLSATPALTQTPSTTPNLQLSIPADGELDWGPLMETDLRALDAILGGTTAAPWSILTSTPYHITNSTNHTTLFTVGMDGSVLTLGGGTFGGPVVLPADPTSPMQASTKQYVDNKTANALSTGTALKATSLAATPTGCDPGMVSNTFDAQGNATNCFTPAGSGSGGTSGTIVASPFKHKPFYSATGDSGTTLSADTGAMTDGNGNETAVSLSANNPHIALQYKQAHSFNSSDYQQCQADGGGCTGGDSPFNFTDNLNIRHPGGGGPNSFNIFLNANSGWENNSNILVNYNAFQVTGNFHTPGQVGGLLSTSMNQMSAGDGVLETTAGFGWGCGRGEDECLEPHRDFYAFFDANFGGLLTLGTPDVAGHQPMTLQAFGGYNTFWIGEQNVLMDVSKRTQLGNVIGGVSTDGGAFLTLTLDAPHNMGVSTITQLTRAVDATAYNGVCGAQTATGGVYSFIEPNVGQDGFSTLSNGLGTPGENANYSFQNPSYPDGTLLGVCVQVASTAGLAAGTEVEFSHFFMDNEYTPVIQVYDATHFTAFMHHPHDIGTTVSWGGGVGLGFGMNADERTPGFNDSVQDAQSSVLRLVYPIVYTSDSTHVTIWTNAEQSNGTAEFKTLGRYTNVPQQATSMALTVTNGVVTSFVQDGDGIPNNYIAAEVGAGAAPNLPLGPIVYGGSHACTTNPVWAFEPIDDQNELTYIAQLVSGGSGCPSDLTMTIQPYPNQAYTMPATWIYRDVDPSNGQVGDGYLLALAIDPTKWSNGDEVAQGMWWGRYNSEKKFLTGDPIVGHSARFGISNLETYAYMQSGQPYKQLSNFTPASYYFGQFINGVWTAVTPTDQTDAPAPSTEYSGVMDGLQWDLPPYTLPYSGGLGGGRLGSQVEMGGFMFHVECGYGNVNYLDAPCFRDQYPQIGLFDLNVGGPAGQMRLIADPVSGDLSWNGDFESFQSSVQRNANFGNIFDDGVHGNFQIEGYQSMLMLSTNLNPFDPQHATELQSDAQLSAGGFSGGTVYAGAQVAIGPGLFSLDQTSGTTELCYAATSNTNLGEGTWSGGSCTLTGNSDLAAHPLFVKPLSTPGSQFENIYKWDGTPGTEQVMTHYHLMCAHVTNVAQGCNDSGQGLGGQTPPAVDRTGNLYASTATVASWNPLSASFGASGSNHSTGLVPDPGATQGVLRFLREDGTWVAPGGSGGSGGSLSVNASGAACASGIALCVNSGSSFTVDNNGNEISNSISTAGNNIQMALATGGAPGYSNITLNGDNTNGNRLGLVGGNASTGDAEMYLDTPAGGQFVFRVGGTSGTCTLGVEGLDCPEGELSADSLHESLTTPASASATCDAGDFTDDANFHYVCTSANTWKSIPLTAFGSTNTGGSGGSGGGSSAPAPLYTPAALCSGGVAGAAGLQFPSVNAPVPGCVDPTQSGLAYLDFGLLNSTSPQYAYGSFVTPANWTGTNISLNFYTAQTTGTAQFAIFAACVTPGSTPVSTPLPYGNPTGATITVNATANILTTAVGDQVLVSPQGACGPGSEIEYKIQRGPSDTVAGDLFLTGVTLTQTVSQ